MSATWMMALHSKKAESELSAGEKIFILFVNY